MVLNYDRSHFAHFVIEQSRHDDKSNTSVFTDMYTKGAATVTIIGVFYGLVPCCESFHVVI